MLLISLKEPKEEAHDEMSLWASYIGTEKLKG